MSAAATSPSRASAPVRAKRWTRALPYVTSLALLAGLASLLDWATLARLARAALLPELAAGALLFALSVLLRGWRFALLFTRVAEHAVGQRAGFVLATLNNFGNHVLPMRLGELVFLFVARFTYGVRATSGLLTLVSARLYDLVALMLLVAGALLFTPAGRGPWLLALLVAIALALGTAIRLDLALALSERVVQRSLGRLAKGRLGARLLALTGGVRDALPILRRPSVVALQLGSALAIWMCLFACFFVLLRAFGTPVDPLGVVLGGAATGLQALLPVNTLGSLGMLEAAWTAGFVAVGLRPSDAVASGLGMHGVVILVSGMMAAGPAFSLGGESWRRFREWREHERSG